MTTELDKGMTVRDRKWGGRHVGTITIVNVGDGRVFVAWHGTCRRRTRRGRCRGLPIAARRRAVG